MRRPRRRVRLSRVYFTVENPAWWKRYVVVLHMGSWSSRIFRSWSWDKADDQAERWNDTIKRIRRDRA